MRKKLIIGIVAGVAVVGGIVMAIICHKRRRDAFRELDMYDDDDDDFWDEDLDDEDCGSDEKCCEYAERILRELEEGTYGE